LNADDDAFLNQGWAPTSMMPIPFPSPAATAPGRRPVMPPLILWSMDGCPFCEKARAYFTQAGIPFREMKENDRAARQRLYDLWELPEGKRSFPQVWIDGWRIGGFDDLVHERLAEHWPRLAA
jgi:glutaredoxin